VLRARDSKERKDLKPLLSREFFLLSEGRGIGR
jgi:hypothetical protein